jgi:hypothetical protein
VSDLIEEQRIRYPPFEPNRWRPEALPIAENHVTIGSYESKDLALEQLQSRCPPFKLGEEDSWMIERRYRYNDEILSPEEQDHWLESNKFPRVVNRQRRGWYLIPNPIHNILRKFINGVVIVLLISLAYLAVSPILTFLGIPVYGLDSVRWGLLDYPILATVVVPLIFAPLLIRVFANLIELRRQNIFLQRNLEPPNIAFKKDSVSNEHLSIDLKFPEWDEGWKHADVTWRVGILPPARESLLETLGRTTHRQPPPGLSTELPHHWEAGLDDGTAGGEDAPMELQQVKGGLYLRPMRIMAQGTVQRWNSGEPIELAPPEPYWPGTVSSSLLRIHWECIVRIEREKGGALLWVQPLKVAHYSSTELNLETLPLHDGRSESDVIPSTH